MDFYSNSKKANSQRQALNNQTATTIPPNAGRMIMPTTSSVGNSTPGSKPSQQVVIPKSSQKRTEKGTVSSTVTSGVVTITFDTPFTAAPIITGLTPVGSAAANVLHTVVVSTTGITAVLYDIVGAAVEATVTTIHWAVEEA
ncbi:MAG: hypothetical protein KC800_05970 [Candidatus Eremiobacteraeota bacterium]|nr:hypothetical protein [Candidatus Eremiobacteraeota bacterium]